MSDVKLWRYDRLTDASNPSRDLTTGTPIIQLLVSGDLHTENVDYYLVQSILFPDKHIDLVETGYLLNHVLQLHFFNFAIKMHRDENNFNRKNFQLKPIEGEKKY